MCLSRQAALRRCCRFVVKEAMNQPQNAAYVLNQNLLHDPMVTFAVQAFSGALQTPVGKRVATSTSVGCQPIIGI